MYLFAQITDKKGNNNNRHLDSHLTMKRLVDICHKDFKKFEDRSTVTATGMKKYMATKYRSQYKGKHSQDLIRHRAHNETTHNAHYRKVTAQETTIITDILENIMENQIQDRRSSPTQPTTTKCKTTKSKGII